MKWHPDRNQHAGIETAQEFKGKFNFVLVVLPPLTYKSCISRFWLPMQRLLHIVRQSAFA